MGPAAMDAPDTPPTLPAAHPSSRRIGLVLAFIGIAIGGLVGRVAYLQTRFASEMAGRVERQHASNATLEARRGGIFDRNGLMLAGSTLERNVFADPKFMHEQFAAKGDGSWFDFDAKLERLADRLFADPNDVALDVGSNPDKRYLTLARGIDTSEADDAVAFSKTLGLRGVATEPQARRVYPMAQTAAHVLGTVGRDDNGLEGLEQKFDAVLAGHDGRMVTERDKRRRAIAAAMSGYQPPRHGSGLVLTIDARIQQIAERELVATCDAFNAVGASVVVMDPHTGDVLALANVPTYHPQFPGDTPVANRRNRALVDPYEPGSVMKPFLMAGLLERGITQVEEVFDTQYGVKRMPVGRLVRDDYGYEKLNAWDGVVKSSNIVMHEASDRLGYDGMTDIYRDFGFGSKTNVGLGGEHRGLIYKNPPDKFTQGSIAFGYAMMATPAQLVRGMAALANGGRLISPRLVKGTVDVDGALEPVEVAASDLEAVSPAVADTMRRILADVFVRGTAKHARSDKYNLFGKTGTAHQSDGGRQSDTKYFASFIGGGPYEAPRLVIAVTVDQPQKELGYHGGQVAGGTAARILEQSLELLGTPHSPQLPEPPPSVADGLHNYYANQYKPKRTLRDSAYLETTPALEAEEDE